MKINISILLLILVLLAGCGKQSPEIPSNQILVKVADRVITKDEFIRRAEYTIRPFYCKQDNYIHKKIILNSLIAEKLLALEAGTDNELVQNEEFQKYIQGRKEQAMRQYFYIDRAYNKVRLDSIELKKVYQLAGRTYNVQFLRLPDERAAAAAVHLYENEGISFEDIAREVLPDSEIPTRKIGFNSDINEDLFQQFFSEPLQKDQLLNPVKIDDGSYLFMKISGWENEQLITDVDIRNRMKNVREKLHTIHANQIYSQQVSEIMKGKTVEFTEETFFDLVRILGPRYLKSMQDKEDAFNRQFWGQTNEVELDSSLGNSIDELRNKPLFNLDGKTWTVAEFEDLVKSHPLVFRKRQISQSEFPEQFKFAVADLIRDYFITQEAYKAAYGKNVFVKNYTDMWNDNLVSIYWRNEYINRAGFQGNFGNNYMKAIENYLNPYVDSLQRKYSDLIEINIDAFEKIDLTNIDMFALQKNVPYPIVSPAFPLITTDHKLDYGKKIN
ncbi:hypothetical protein KJ762_16165 [bacterium]|nr:hypothetical protein [bacterium]MBU1636020.1 hypothetical protein [bacterium]